MKTDIPKPDGAARLTVSIVLHRGNLEYFRATLAGLREAVTPAVGEVKLSVVDQSLDQAHSDAAREICVRTLGASRIHWEYLELNKNAGYGAGHNVAIHRELGRFHLIMNPDVELPPDWLTASLEVMELQPDVVLYGTRGKNRHGEEEYLAKRFPTVWVLLLRAFGTSWLKRIFHRRLSHYELRDLPVEPAIRDVPLLSGCCLLAKSDVLKRVQGFDESFFLYFEDYDLAMRMREHGRIVRSGALQFIHHGGQASKKGWRHILWFAVGGVRFFSRWGWRWV